MYKSSWMIVFALLSSGVSLAADIAVRTEEQAWLDIARADAKEMGNPLDEQAFLVALRANEALAAEAMRLGIDKRPDFAAREAMKRRELLASLLIRDHLAKNPVGEEAIKAEYDRVKAQRGGKEYSARHIQLTTEAEAKEAIAQLSKGADFARLAKEKSLDASSKDKGGQLDWVTRDALKAPLGEALAKLQQGLFNTIPLRTDAGWHVLKLEGVRDARMPPYEAMKERIAQRLRTQQINRYIESLRAQAGNP